MSRLRSVADGSGLGSRHDGPVRALSDDVAAHPYAVAIESAHLAPSAQVSLYPWKANPEQIQLALRHIGTFLKANRPAATAQRPMAAAAQ